MNKGTKGLALRSGRRRASRERLYVMRERNERRQTRTLRPPQCKSVALGVTPFSRLRRGASACVARAGEAVSAPGTLEELHECMVLDHGVRLCYD